MSNTALTCVNWSVTSKALYRGLSGVMSVGLKSNGDNIFGSSYLKRFKNKIALFAIFVNVDHEGDLSAQFESPR